MRVSPGEKIKELRLLCGMSQEELGKRIGVQRAAINKYEKGTVTNIPLQTIENIAKVFDVSPTYIVGWDGNGGNPLAAEVKVLTGVREFFGAEAVDLLESYVSLNRKGKKKLFDYACDLERIDIYQASGVEVGGKEC